MIPNLGYGAKFRVKGRVLISFIICSTVRVDVYIGGGVNVNYVYVSTSIVARLREVNFYH